MEPSTHDLEVSVETARVTVSGKKQERVEHNKPALNTTSASRIQRTMFGRTPTGYRFACKRRCTEPNLNAEKWNSHIEAFQGRCSGSRPLSQDFHSSRPCTSAVMPWRLSATNGASPSPRQFRDSAMRGMKSNHCLLSMTTICRISRYGRSPYRRFTSTTFKLSIPRSSITFDTDYDG